MPCVRDSKLQAAHILLYSDYVSPSTARCFGRIQVFLDGQLFFSASVPYPRRISEPLARCSIGWNLDGQTSGVLLLSGVASLKIVKSMLNRLAGRPDDVIEGADAFGSSSPDLDLWDDTTTVSAQQRLKRKLLGSKYQFFAALLPNRTVDGLCLEPHNGHHGLFRGPTHGWVTHTAQDVIRSIGGSPSLLSLANGLLSEPPDFSLGRKIPSCFTGRSVDTVLSVLLSFLDGSVANQVRSIFTGFWPHLLEPEVCSCALNGAPALSSSLSNKIECLMPPCLIMQLHLPRVSPLSGRFLCCGGRGDPSTPSQFCPQTMFFLGGGAYGDGAGENIPDLQVSSPFCVHPAGNTWSS